MRILIANYEFPPIGGGASKVSYELARTLVGLGHDVIVLTSRYGKLPQHEILDGIEVHRVRSWRNGPHDSGVRGAFTYLLSALPRLRRILKTGHIDVVHYFFGLPTGFLSLYSYSLCDIPYIISLRGSDVPLYDRDSKKLRILHWLTRPLSHRIWKNAVNVFAVSKGLRDLAEASFPDVSVDVIYNGTDVDDCPAPPRNPDEKKLRLICVARLIPRKGVGQLLDALASIAGLEWELTVIGTGPSEATLQKQAEVCGIADRVRFAGFCSREEVKRHYRAADVFVLPTNSDAFANVILEAMSAGLPVIATDVGGVAEAVQHGETGILVPPRRPDQLARAITRLAEDPELRTRLGRAGLKRVRNVFTWEKNARRYVAGYVNALKPSMLQVERPADQEP